jgi:hypothetical protein
VGVGAAARDAHTRGMTSIPEVLLDHDLPAAELAALRLDGELFALGDGFCPFDRLDSPALRAASVCAGRPARLIAELGTAAWIWGARTALPRRREFGVDIGARARPSRSPELAVREVVLDPDDTVELGGGRVTTPLRTVVDLARTLDRVGPDDADAMRALARLGGFGLDACTALMNRRRNLAGKRRALERLAAILAETDEPTVVVPAQPPLTR